MRKYYIIVLWLIYFSITCGINYYVDNNANGLNNGTTWENAWESFNAINWSSIQPGDIIYISGGSSGKIYADNIVVNASGNSSSPITIMKGIDAGHNGEVILQGSGLGAAVNIANESYIIVSNLSINNWSRAVDIDGDSNNAAHDIIIDNCDGIMSGRFIFIDGYADVSGSYCHDITIRNCDVTTPSSTGHQNDFVYAQYMAGLTIESNNVNISSNDTSEHNDLLQTLWVDGPVIVRNNYFEHSDNKLKNSQGIFFENHEGTFEVYNNIIVMPNSVDGKIYWKADSLNNAHTIIYSNVSYGLSGSLIQTTDPDAVIKNNILYSTGYNSIGSSYMLEFNGVSGSGADVANNLFYDPADNMNNMNSGTNQNGVEGNPLFTDLSGRDFTLQTGSPAIDTGATLQSPYNVDIIGTSRPLGPLFDIGPYEMIDNGTGNYIRVNTGWNFISIPKLSNNMTSDYLLPTRTSSVFEYVGGSGYQVVNNLQNGKGYAVKFGYPQYIFIEGDSIFFPIEVFQGWNLIGPFDENIPVSQVQSVPSGIIISDFYWFDGNGYVSSNMLEIAKGYWVKVSSDGVIKWNTEPESRWIVKSQR